MHETYDRDIHQLVEPARIPGAITPRLGIVGGGRKAGLLAVQMLAMHDATLQARGLQFKRDLARSSRAKDRQLQRNLPGRRRP